MLKLPGHFRQRWSFILIPTFLLFFLPILIGSEAASQATNDKKKTAAELLPDLAKFPSFQTGLGILFTEQNPLKLKVIRAILSEYRLSERVEWKSSSEKTLHYFTIEKGFETPSIEFRKLNPTKYRLRIHNARSDFPLIFSESFHDSWKIYIVPWRTNRLSPEAEQTQTLLNSYKIFKGNEKSQAGLEELKKFLAQGKVTDLNPKKSVPRHFIFSPWEKENDQEASQVNFISKQFFNTVQNNNLPENAFWETWFSQKMIIECIENRETNSGCTTTDLQKWQNKSGWNANAVQLPDLLHWKVNAFANSWWIKSDYIRQLPSATKDSEGFFKLNPDGSFDFEVVIEYWPQRLFYFGWAITIVIFITCVLLLQRRRLSVEKEETS